MEPKTSTNLACVILSHQNVPSCQVSVDKGFAGEIGHAGCYVSTEVKELLGPRIIQIFSKSRR